MKAVSVTNLKAHLAKYLREVKKGNDVEIVERGVPVARLVGLAPPHSGKDVRFERLVKLGIIHPGTGDPKWVLTAPPIDVGDADISGSLREDREDRL